MVTREGVVWNENESVWQHYNRLKELGLGGFAVVFLGEHKVSGELRAIKTLPYDSVVKRKRIFAEIKHGMLMRDHPHVVQTIEVFEDDKELSIVMEYCSGGELHDLFVAGRTQVTYGIVAKVLMVVLEVVDSMHQMSIVHCDLKPSNFLLACPTSLLDPAFHKHIKLIDFGLSQRLRSGQLISGLAGSKLYMAPEVLQKSLYSHKVDIWSVGVMIYTLLTGRLPFDGEAAQLRHAVCHTQPDLSQVHPAVAEIVTAMLDKDPERRPTARQVLQHAWLAHVADKMDDQLCLTKLCLSNEVYANLKHFVSCNHLQRLLMRVAVRFIGVDEAKALVDAFESIDIDKDRQLDFDEMEALLTAGRAPAERKRMLEVLEKVMRRGDSLTVETFMVAAMSLYRTMSDGVVKDMFRALDSNRDGWITAAEVAAFLTRIGVPVTAAHVEALFEQYVGRRRVGELATKTGMMTYHEFHALVMPTVSQRFTSELDPVLENLARFCASSSFERLARSIVAEALPAGDSSDGWLARVQAAFALLDVDGSGMLSREEIAHGIRSAGFLISDADIDNLLRTLDMDGSGDIQYSEFLSGCLQHSDLTTKAMLSWLFDFMDEDGNGVIDEAELASLLEHFNWDARHTRKVLAEACRGGGACRLDFQQFCHLMNVQAPGDGAEKVEAVADALQAAQTMGALRLQAEQRPPL